LLREICRRFLDSRFSHVTPLKAQTNKGGKRSSLYDSEVIVACLAKYNLPRLMQYSAFGIDEGLAQMAGVPIILPRTAKPALDLAEVA
jgi:hypothetical protein